MSKTIETPDAAVATASAEMGPRTFFLADLGSVSSKADVPSLEFPLFALRAGDRRERHYEREGVSIEVQPGSKGCATLHDADLWIYCISQLVHGFERGRKDVSRTVRFTAYDFLKATRRGTSGAQYQRLGDALARLRGTSIETNIATAGQRERRGFGLVDEWRVVERDEDERMVAIEVTLPDWLFRSIRERQVLTLDPAYFELRGALERRIYALCRKHCGRQKRWRIGLTLLHEKAGSASTRKRFRQLMKQLVEADNVPGYRLAFDVERDQVTVYSRAPGGQLAALSDSLS